MMYRFLKTQNLSYSMIRSCLKDHSLVGLLDKSCSSQFCFWMQMRSIHNHSSEQREEHDHAVYKRKLRQNMLKYLKVGAQDEEKKLAKLKEKKLELKNKAQYEVQLTGIPAVIRAMVPSLFLNTYHSYTGVLYYPTPVDCFFEIKHREFQTSKAYDGLCLKLEAPYYLPMGFSGSHALLKLCEKTAPGASIFNFYEDANAINELFEVVNQNKEDLVIEDLMKLIHYSYILKGFSLKCSRDICGMFVRKANSDVYSVSELLDFLDSLKQVDKSILKDYQIVRFEELTERIWNYISVRPQRISCSLLKRLYLAAPRNHEKLYSVLDKLLFDNLDLLETCDVFIILKEIQSRGNALETEARVCLRLEQSVKTATYSDLEILLPDFLENGYISPLIFKVIANVMRLNTFSKTDQILKYCTLALHYDEKILTIACRHYIKDENVYSSEQLYCLLQAIGTLNFVPERQREFFTKVESYLMENFYNIGVLALLEMFVYLIYIDRVAVNFSEYIFAPLFLGIVSEMKDEDRLKATRCIRIIDMAFTARKFDQKTNLPVDQEMNWRMGDKGTHALIEPVLTEILEGASHVQKKHRPTGSDCYLEMKYSVLAEKAGRAQRFRDDDRLAFLVMTQDAFCNNKEDHMLGEEMANIRLLQEQGLTVIWVHEDKIKELDEQNKLDAFVKSLFLQLLDSVEENLARFSNVADNGEEEMFH